MKSGRQFQLQRFLPLQFLWPLNYHFYLLIPLSFFLGVLITTSRLYGDNEIYAIFSEGKSLIDIIKYLLPQGADRRCSEICSELLWRIIRSNNELEWSENFEYLYWTAPAHGKTKGYYILMRETSSPVWQKKIFTAETEIRLPYSKDNYLFSVQSIDELGHASLPVFPIPIK